MCAITQLQWANTTARPLPFSTNNPIMPDISFETYRKQLQRLPIAIVAINAIIWLWSVSSGVDWYNPSPLTLQQWGGNISLLTMTGQAWRLFTAMFMHAGFMHILVNMFFLVQIGPLLVQRIGAIGFAAVYILGGLLSSISTTAWQTYSLFSSLAAGSQPQIIVSVGASGAVMAVAGALTWEVFASQKGWGQRALTTFHNNQQLKSALLRTIGLNVFLGFVIPGLDQAAHVGGIAAGALVAALLPTPASFLRQPQKLTRLAIAIVAAICLLFVLYMGIHSIYGARLEALMPYFQR